MARIGESISPYTTNRTTTFTEQVFILSFFKSILYRSRSVCIAQSYRLLLLPPRKRATWHRGVSILRGFVSNRKASLFRCTSTRRERVCR